MNRTNQTTSRRSSIRRNQRLNKRKLGFEPLEARRLLTAELEPNDSPAQATLFTRGEQTLEGTIASRTDVDWYQVALEAGDRLFIGSSKDDFSGISGSASQMPQYVIQDSSHRVWGQSDVGRVDGFTAVNAGIYYVGLFHDNVIQDFLGPYSVAAWTIAFDGVVEAEPNETLPTATSLDTKEKFAGQFATVSDVDIFKVELRAGDSIGLRYSGAAGPAAELVGPDGKLVASNTSGLGLAANTNVSGAHFLRLTTGPQQFTGNYQASLVRSARGISTEGGNSFETAASLTFANVVPASALGTTSSFATHGLVGSYVNQSLTFLTGSADWRTTQAIAGTRVDRQLEFLQDSWGVRSEVGLTKGSDANWDEFAVQWDGFIRVPADGYRLSTSSDDGSRVWVDTNRNGIFEDTPSELISSGWGGYQFFTFGPFSQPLLAGDYAIRVQYNEALYDNRVVLAWSINDAQGSQAPKSGESAAGMLSSVGEADYYAVNLDANQRYRFQLSSTSTSLYPRPGKSLASDGRRISLYNEYGQWLESSYADATSANYFFARPEVTGRHYIVVEALTDNGLGGYSLSMVNETFGKERLNHVIYTDYSQHAQGDLNELVSAGIRSIYAPFQTQITLQKPPAGKEHVTFELRPDANGSYCGGLGGGQYGNLSPNGSAWVGRGTTCGTWDSFSAVWFDGILHELGHSIGIPHNYHPRTGATIFTVGSYLVNHNTPGYTTPFLQQERRYADWVLQSGAQESELEPNDSALLAQDLDEPLGRMTLIGDALDDQVVVSGRIRDKHDADWYAITLAAGQSLALDVDSSEHQLGLDSSITVVDAQGAEVATADNSLDRESQIASLDPFLIFQATTAGKYYVVVKGVGLSTGAYRLKVTPDSAMDQTAPRIYYAWPQPDQVVDETRQIVLWVDDLLDPVTVNNQTFILRGAATGIIQGKFTFDALDSTVIFTADAKLTPDTYTLTMKSGDNGVKDLWGNPLDGETAAGKLAFPSVSGDGVAGGDFVTKIVVGSADTTPATVDRLRIHPPDVGVRDAANRLVFQMYFSDEMDIVSLYSADWQLRGSGADGKFDTADDPMQSLDVFVDKRTIGQSGIWLYALGNVPPGSYRFDADVLDAAGHNVQVKYATFLGGVVPAAALFQDAALTQPGLTGSYFNQNLASAIAETDWRATRAVSGTRVDPVIDFDTYGWGDRSQTGVTGGTSHWDNFSAQWDGFIEIPVDGVQLVTNSDDSSRLWIDLNRNGQFEPSELANNHFGQGQALTVGDPTQKISTGSYAIRIQYEERWGGNDMVLQWSDPTPELGWQRTHFAPVVIGTNIPVFSKLDTPFKEVVVKFGSDVDPAALTPDNFVVRYSPNERFFDSDDELLRAKDGTVQWNPITREATWKPASVPKVGYYMVELSGEKNGIAGPNGALLDGEFLDSYIPGGRVLQGDGFSPSGDSIPGGTYRFAFAVDFEEATLALTLNPTSISENGGTSAGKVTRNTPTEAALVVSLSSSDPSAATVPVTVTIPAGATFVTFTISAVDDSVVDGDQLTTITAAAIGHVLAEQTLEVTNDELGSMWQNQRNPLDVNDDGFISPMDVLLIINDINSFGARSLLGTLPGNSLPSYFIDVNGDYKSTPMDILLVINYLNNESIEKRKWLGEGEAMDDMQSSVDHVLSDAAWLMDISVDLIRRKERRIL